MKSKIYACSYDVIQSILFIVFFFFTVSQLQAQCDPNVTVSSELVSSVEVGIDSCELNLNVYANNLGGCDVTNFEVFVAITSPDGTESYFVVFPDLDALTSDTLSVTYSSALFYDDATGACFLPADFTITVGLSPVMGPETITTTVPCPVGTGTLEVCANDNSIVCADNCIVVSSDCEVSVNFDIDPTTIQIAQVGVDSCGLIFNYDISNRGGCDLNSFAHLIRITTPAGDTIFNSVNIAAIASGQSSTAVGGLVSTILYNPVTGACYDASDLLIEFTLDATNPPSVSTIALPCTTGTGTIVVCTNDNTIVCEENCVELPATCETILDFEVIEATIDIASVGTDSCSVCFDFTLANNGGCDLSGFDINIVVTSPEGFDQDIYQVAGPIISDTTIVYSTCVSSAFFFDDMTGDCFDVSALNISMFASTTQAPEPITTTVTCKTGLGTMEVCANNQDIICSDADCIAPPPTCDVDLKLEVDSTTLQIGQVGFQCQLRFAMSIVNDGDCDLDSFAIDFTVTSPAGVINQSQLIPGPLPSGSTVNFPISIVSPFLFNGTVCYTLADLTLNYVVSPTNPAEAITVTVPCTVGTGTMEVCANNNAIVCDDSECIPPDPTCLANMTLEIDQNSHVLTDVSMSECMLEFNFDIKNEGFCDLDTVQLQFTVSTAFGAEDWIMVVPGPIPAMMTSSFSTSYVSSILKNGNICFTPGEINVSGLVFSAPESMLVTIPCPTGPGTVTVCANDNTITCGDCEITIATEWTGFTATMLEDAVSLEWQVENEFNSDYYIIEHSEDGSTFVELDMVSAKSNAAKNDYTYQHDQPISGANYYRLLQVDLNGNSEYSVIRVVKFNSIGSSVNIYPNPAADELFVELDTDFEAGDMILIFDITGKKQMQSRIDSANSVHKLQVKDLESGTYLVQIIRADEIQVKKLIKK